MTQNFLNTDQLMCQKPNNRLMLQKFEETRRSRSMIVEDRKTEQRFRKTMKVEQKIKNPKQEQSAERVQRVYGEAQQFIRNFDTTIIKCRRFNEVKTYRKYEVIMRDMELEIIKLKDKLQMQQQMRTPTKDYLSDILNKLVEYKTQNERLKVLFTQANKTIAEQQNQIQLHKSALQKLENMLRGKIDRLPSIQHTRKVGDTLESPVKCFLQAKTLVNEEYGLHTSKLEEFLKNSWQHLWSWDITKLLSQIDKFVEKVPENMQVDMWKIRLGVTKRLSSVMDTAPNKSVQSLTNITLSEMDTQQQDASHHKQRKPHWSLQKRNKRK